MNDIDGKFKLKVKTSFNDVVGTIVLCVEYFQILLVVHKTESFN